MRSAPPLSLLALVASLGAVGLSPAGTAAEPASPPVTEAQINGDARAAVSANFCVRSQDPQHRADRVAGECERQRLQLQRRWLGEVGPHWQQRCEVVIYANEFDYLRHLGHQAAMTRGVCKIDRQNQRITARHISLMADPQTRQLTALAHELTHLVLADRFPSSQPPRWADEGIALLADGAEKRSLHLRDLRGALAAQCCPSLQEMFVMHRYPEGSRRPAFYGQSLSLVTYLAELQEPAKVVDLITLATDRGYPWALQEIYGIASVAELEQRWRGRLNDLTLPVTVRHEDPRH